MDGDDLGRRLQQQPTTWARLVPEQQKRLTAPGRSARSQFADVMGGVDDGDGRVPARYGRARALSWTRPAPAVTWSAGQKRAQVT